jgi:hypothetical protein
MKILIVAEASPEQRATFSKQLQGLFFVFYAFPFGIDNGLCFGLANGGAR